MVNERDIRNINGVWPLEGFVTQKNAEIGIKYGFIGLGQGGSKIVDAFAGIKSPKTGDPIYPCMIVNSNLGDMRSLRNIPKHMQFPLEGYANGVGKNPEVGKVAFTENGEKIFEAIGSIMDGCDMIYVCAALGGGTGTGAINVLVDAIADYLGIPVAAITSLPRPDEVESLNAYNASAELVTKLREFRNDDNGGTYRVLENLNILDNEKIINEHIQDPEVQDLTWDYYSNYKVASILHEWNVVTSLESDITLDAADLLNHVLRRGGVITYAKKKINMDEIRTREELINEIISTYGGRNVLANGFDYKKDMESMGLVVVMPRDRKDMLNQDTLEIIRSKMKGELPNISFYPGFATHSSSKYAIVYTMASMAGLPERARNLRDEAQELIRIREEREKQASGFHMGEKLTTAAQQTAATSTRRGGGNPFATKADNDQSVEKKRNPFAK